VPASLEEVTAVGAEAPARDLGVSPEAVARVWNAARRLYESGLHPAIQLCVRRHGQVQLLLQGGELDGVRIFDPRTIRRATSEQSYLEFDLTLLLPFRYGMGFMLGGQWFSPYGPDTQYAFGHIGFTNVLTWADPERQVAAALLTSGKPLVYPELYYVWDVLRQIGLACGKERARPRAAAAAPAAQRSVS